MTDRAYVIRRMLENKIAIAENNDQNTLFISLDVLKEIVAFLKEQEGPVNNLGITGLYPKSFYKG